MWFKKKETWVIQKFKKYGHMKVHVKKEKNDENMKAHVLKKRERKPCFKIISYRERSYLQKEYSIDLKLFYPHTCTS